MSTVASSDRDREPIDLDTLNAPAGKLVTVFLAACPSLHEIKRPFAAGTHPRIMRDAAIQSRGRSGLIARHRMIEFLPYFLEADPDWTAEHLITPLNGDTTEAIALWRAIARRTRFKSVLDILGGAMAERTVDRRLGRETRQSLIFSLVIECLHALRGGREPAVPYARVQQTIRSLDDEVRAYAAGAVQRFLKDVSASNGGTRDASSAEGLFRSAAAPFLQRVWPQERSLVTPGISKAMARVPAAARSAFAEASDAVERFLVPFDCWSMLDYDLYGEADGKAKLSMINDPDAALGLLRLLHLTVGTNEGAVVPYDLSDALDQVRKVAPSLAETREFRRLATAARRRG